MTFLCLAWLVTPRLTRAMGDLLQEPDRIAISREGLQPFGRKYFLTLSASVLNRVAVPRRLRICFLVRLIIPCCLPDWAYMTFPVPVILKRFFAPDLGFSLGIWLS